MFCIKILPCVTDENFVVFPYDAHEFSLRQYLFLRFILFHYHFRSSVYLNGVYKLFKYIEISSILRNICSYLYYTKNNKKCRNFGKRRYNFYLTFRLLEQKVMIKKKFYFLSKRLLANFPLIICYCLYLCRPHITEIKFLSLVF